MKQNTGHTLLTSNHGGGVSASVSPRSIVVTLDIGVPGRVVVSVLNMTALRQTAANGDDQKHVQCCGHHATREPAANLQGKAAECSVVVRPHLTCEKLTDRLGPPKVTSHRKYGVHAR